MKIIGATGSSYIVEMSQADMAAIVGETYFSGDECHKKLAALGLLRDGSGWDFRKGDPVIGATIPLAGRFQRLTNLESKHHELRGVSSKLRDMADLMDHLGDAVIVPPKTEETK